MSLTGSGSHPCPAAGCGFSVPASRLMCRAHWYMVPAPLRRAVWAAWGNGWGAGSAGHREAILAAVDAVNAKLAGGQP